MGAVGSRDSRAQRGGGDKGRGLKVVGVYELQRSSL